jgi:hypothetical protein
VVQTEGMRREGKRANLMEGRGRERRGIEVF